MVSFLLLYSSIVCILQWFIFSDELAVIMVDVAPEFEPQIKASNFTDEEKSKVIMFVGETGTGKTTQINAFISYMLGGDLQDKKRILVIDDRNSDQAASITRYITIYRIRPISELFEGKTFYIIDTPGYGDTSGIHRDDFITKAMNVMFNTIPKINTIVLTSKANLSRATPGMRAVITNIFHLFAKNVRGCLRTVLTFSDAGQSPAKRILQELGWLEFCPTVIEVNNSAFRIANADNRDDPKVRDWWNLSMSGQEQVHSNLRTMESVPTAESAQVTFQRHSLSETCDIVQQHVYDTANKTSNLLNQIGAIADAIGKGPQEKVPVTVIETEKVDVEKGKHTTLCLECNMTCHKVCIFGNNEDKYQCSAMDSDTGKCRICEKKCDWNKHQNARFIICPKEVVKYVIPEDLIKHWNKNTNTLEGAALDAMKEYLDLQEQLKVQINILIELTEKLNNVALKHNPEALLNYLDILVKDARARGLHAEQLQALIKAKESMRVSVFAKTRGRNYTSFSVILVLNKVKAELERRNKLGYYKRLAEENLPCNFYNNLRLYLPKDILELAPPKLELSTFQRFGIGSATQITFKENLKAIVLLVQILLKKGIFEGQEFNF